MGSQVAERMEEHYKTFMVSARERVRTARGGCSSSGSGSGAAERRAEWADRARLCRHCAVRPELGPVSCKVRDILVLHSSHLSIPIGYWAIETRDDEPYLAHVSWQ
jgi:hypothetical protein